MVQILPPLPALRAFEAAARHLSFAKAGGELRVTPGAISHQIKQLEEWVGGPLFKRKANRVVLTETGRILAIRINEIFSHIISAGAAARSAENNNKQVHIRCQHSVAAKWLATRVKKFSEANPDISITVQAGPHRWSAEERMPDLAIYNGRGSVPGYSEQILLSGELVAVAAPTLIATMSPISTPADLLSAPLIAVDFNEPGWHDQGWEAWFAAAGLGDVVLSTPISFNLIHLVIEACVAGGGFALVPSFMVERELSRGDLVGVFGIALPNTQPYFLTEPDPGSNRVEVHLFRDWLLKEARSSSGQYPVGHSNGA